MLSLNEVEATLVKAARGAGLPLGVAEDFARFAAYLVATQRGAGAITRALAEDHATPAIDWDADIPRIGSGSAAMVAPMVVDAFAMGHDAVKLDNWAQAEITGAALACHGIAMRWDGLCVSRSDTEVLPCPTGPVSVPEADWQAWQSLAARTYVPESAASRSTGAGAGLTDND